MTENIEKYILSDEGIKQALGRTPYADYLKRERQVCAAQIQHLIEKGWKSDEEAREKELHDAKCRAGATADTIAKFKNQYIKEGRRQASESVEKVECVNKTSETTYDNGRYAGFQECKQAILKELA